MMNLEKLIAEREAVSTVEIAADKPEGLSGFFNLNLDLDRFEDVVKINTLGTVVPSQIFGRDMAALGRGSILNFASMNSFRPLTRVAAYAMSKTAIVNFTQWLAVYLAPAGIRVNAVAPGFFVNEQRGKTDSLTRQTRDRDSHPLRDTPGIPQGSQSGTHS